jgi:hypothetical protein
MSTAEERVTHVQAAMAATEGASSEVQAAAIEAVVPPPSGQSVNDLWMLLVRGLLLLLLISVCGVIFLLVDGKDPDLVVTVFTALLTGMLGLFAPSPSTIGK